MKRVFITSTSFGRTSSEPEKLLVENGWEVCHSEKKNLSDEEIAECIDDFDAIIVGTDKVGKKTLSKATRLKAIFVHGTGIDNIDLEAAQEANIPVINAPHMNACGVAECTFACLLSFIRKIPQAVESIQRGEWCGNQYTGMELNGKTFGILGLGHIGLINARIAKGFGMSVIYFDAIRSQSAEAEYGIEYHSKEEVLANSDFITLHLPLIDATRNFIDAREFSVMKNNAILINTSRGGIVNEDALYHAIKECKIKGAILDVLETEPMEKENPLRSLDQVMITPHIGGYTTESVTRTSMCIVNRLLDYFKTID